MANLGSSKLLYSINYNYNRSEKVLGLQTSLEALNFEEQFWEMAFSHKRAISIIRQS